MSEHVQINAIIPRIRYVANGTTSCFEFPFVIFQAEDLQVYINNELQPSSKYNVSGINETNGGAVNFITPPTKDSTITLMRNLTIKRTTDFQEGGYLRADILNDELDYQTACMQQITDNLNRSLVLPPYASDIDVNFQLPSPQSGKSLVWSKDGKKLENSNVEINILEETLKNYARTASDCVDQCTKLSENTAENSSVATQKASEAMEAATTAVNATVNKANTTMNNLSTTGKEQVVNLIMPSNQYVDLSMPTNATATSYTAPANGYFVIAMSAANRDYSLFFLNKSASSIGSSAIGVGGELYAFCPAKKGDNCQCYRNGTLKHCRFIYAQGEI